jgi:hypothetical protein
MNISYFEQILAGFLAYMELRAALHHKGEARNAAEHDEIEIE